MALNSRCTPSTLGEPGPICLPTSVHSGQGNGETKGLPMQMNHSDCSRLARHALGSGRHAKPNPSVPFQPAKSADLAFQSDSTQESVDPKS